jgi:hypothetical protein
VANKKKPKPVPKKVTPAEALTSYEHVFEEIRRFTSVIADTTEELREAELAAAEAKAAYDAAKKIVQDIRDLEEGARFGLIRYLTPAGGEVLPLFDRMEPADEEVHGMNASQWRLEPIAALRLSLPAQMALTNAEVMLVGQLQDRVLGNAETWWESIAGLNFGMAVAIQDLLNDFINERS